MIDTFNATITIRVVVTGGSHKDAEQLIHSRCELNAEFRSVVGHQGELVFPERDETAHQDICSAFSCTFGCGNSEHIRTVAKSIHEKQIYALPRARCWQGTELVNTDEDSARLASGRFGRRSYPYNI